MSKCDKFIQRHKKLILLIIYSFFLLFLLLSTIYLFQIIFDSKENPLKKEDIIDKSSYFINIEENNNSLIINENNIQCNNYKDTILTKNLSLINIFDLNTGYIFSASIGIIINNVIIFIISCLSFVVYKYCLDKDKNKEQCCDCRCLYDYFWTILFILFILICLFNFVYYAKNIVKMISKVF